jgi:tricorn protease
LLVHTALITAALASNQGYYRQPTLRGDTIVFVAEGDLWRVSVQGGTATRLTTHPATEGEPELSADGTRVAFSAAYEGASEVYVMPVDGGQPQRMTALGLDSLPTGWTQDGRVLVATRALSGLPDVRLAAVDGQRAPEPLPLSQASNGSYGTDGTLFFTRLPFQGSHTRRYRGGTAQDIWTLPAGAPEARNLTAEHPATDRDPVFDGGRVYFLSDRDGTMNVWSMLPDGTDPRQHTRATELEVRELAVDQGRLLYRQGADLYLMDLASGEARLLPIGLDSDFDHMREQWVEDPFSWITGASLSADGSEVVITARGQAFVVPTERGRLVTLQEPGVRYRNARFLRDGSLLVASDAPGEVELYRLPGNGVGAPERLTTDGHVLRRDAVPSPTGRHVAHTDQDFGLFLLDLQSRTNVEIDRNEIERPGDLAWSEDGRWLTYTVIAPNLAPTVRLYDTVTRTRLEATTDKASSYSPTFSHDGDWLYFLTDRRFETVVRSPWSPLWSEPFFDEPTVIMALALQPGLRPPFAPPDELHPEPVPAEPEDEKERKRARRKAPAGGVEIEADGLVARIVPVPVPGGNRSQLQAGLDRLFWLQSSADPDPVSDLMVLELEHEAEPRVLVRDVRGYELSADRKRLLVARRDGLYVVDATFAPGGELGEHELDLSGWQLSVSPREEWRQMFEEAWRLERDYFYDPKMHGVDWPAVRLRYRPLLDRVTDRSELSDLVAQMVGELSALHTFVFGGDFRRGDDTEVRPASLGADWVVDEAAGGWRITRVWQSDPDRPELRSPLARVGAEVAVGEVITRIDGVPTLSVPDPALLLRGKAGQQVLLHVSGQVPAKGRKRGGPAQREVVVVPLAPGEAGDRRYHEWEHTRRLEVEQRSQGKIGYIHLRAMGAQDMADWMRGYLPIFARDGLIIDVRHNGGGNIDSWILERLMRKAWMYWSQRVGRAPLWNMQYAFRGHLVVLCDEFTGSDGEAFAEGFRRLGLGEVIGTRTWGGEIWLSMSNVLVDGGIASAAEFGVFGPEGAWLIEGHGVEPDQVVDNLPVATFRGQDAQLEAALAHLQAKIAAEPIVLPEVPAHPVHGSATPPAAPPAPR